MLVAVDPGVHACGVAVFRDTKLERAAYVESGGGPLQLRDAVKHWLALTEPARLVVEKPQVYQARLQKGDPNDLIDLAVVVGTMLTILPDSETVLPARWKGQVPKEIMNVRVMSKLAPAEEARVSWPKARLRHNVIDAIGIGLWAVGRL